MKTSTDRGGGFVARHGSWNRSVANGDKIQAWGRPVGVTVARDGSLLVADDGSNVIGKISAKK